MAPSSFFSVPEKSLDPKLFGEHGGDALRGTVRAELLSFLYATLDRHFSGARNWARAWIAGSGVSYQWSAARDPGDLDVLVGVLYEEFRHLNPDYRQMSDVEISKMINEIFRAELQPYTADWHGYEVTFYVFSGQPVRVCSCDGEGLATAVSPSSESCSICGGSVSILDPSDIRTIKPYAAYSLTDNGWTVRPTSERPRIPQEWEHEAAGLHQLAQLSVRRYSEAHTSLMNAPHDASRLSAERAMEGSLAQAAALFDQVHEGRKIAFGPSGQGYADRHNFLWQAAKRDGWLPALREMKDYYDDLQNNRALATYGVELPDTDTLIRRAAQSYASQATMQTE